MTGAARAAGGASTRQRPELDYELPPSRIAQRPLRERDASRLLHLAPDGRIEDLRFRDLPALLEPGDLLVVNDTRVRAARLRGRLGDGGEAELLVLATEGGGRFRCLVRPGRRLRQGSVVDLGPGLRARVLGPAPGHPGARRIAVEADGGADPEAALERAGSVPLPPYVRVPLEDGSRYQTVYSASAPPASAAAPTAGLHFTERVLAELARRGVERTAVRLEVGLGTFAPVRAERPSDHVMHAERCGVPGEAAAAVARARRRGSRVVAVGTTVVRTLESRAAPGGLVEAGEGTTDLCLRPGSPLRVVDGLLTNFHQPRSSLLLLLGAVVGVEAWRRAYAHALAADYRFLSFGDCMLCWRRQGSGGG